MKQTWRWFGPADTVSTDDMLQAGVEGVVSALHHVPTGNVWTTVEIKNRQKQIASRKNGSPSGLTWDVVESVPVSEQIKTRSGDFRGHIEAYKQSLINLAECGLKTVCYNFMPILDWTRTELRSPMPHGGSAMRFDLVDFAVFDIHILARPDALQDYSSDIVEQARLRFSALSASDRDTLASNIVAGLPGANDNWSLDDVRTLLATYRNIGAEQLRANLVAFLEAIVPVAERVGINLCCHPDDPPFPLLGLPRIMSTADDYAQIMQAVDSAHNGITLCTGSLGVATDFDFTGFVEQWGHRIHFVHLRNTRRDGPSDGHKHSFFEAAHLEGDTNMVSVISALLAEEAKRRENGRADAVIPMRPDHGQDILSDIGKNTQPGYPLIGRMRGLAELRGVMKAMEM
jgi:mannonate dehydratase